MARVSLRANEILPKLNAKELADPKGNETIFFYLILF